MNSTFRTTRRTFAALGCATGLLLAACSPPSNNAGDGGRLNGGDKEEKDLPACPLDALEAADGKVKVDLWYGGLGGSPDGVLKSMAKEFNKSQDKIEVSVASQGDSYEEALRKYRSTSATPKQLPGILYLEDTMLGELVDRGQVLPAESCMKADGYDMKQIELVARSSYSVDGVLYPGYMNVSTPVLYYNKLHFKKAGLDPEDPPKTFAEIEEVAKILKEKGISKEPLSFKSDQWFFNTWLAGMGSEAVNNDNGRSAPPTESTFNNEDAMTILTELQKMRDEGLVATFPLTEGSISHFLALLEERSSMLVETSTASSTIRDFLSGQLDAEAVGEGFASAEIDEAKTKVVPGAGEMPGPKAGGKVYASGGAFYIMNTSSDAEQAASWEFMKWMLKPENALIWHTQGGYLPVVKEVLDDPKVEEFWKTDIAGVMLKKAVDQLKDADPEQPGPLMGPFNEYKTITNQMLYDVMGPDLKDPKKALDDAEKSVNDLLKDYNS